MSFRVDLPSCVARFVRGGAGFRESRQANNRSACSSKRWSPSASPARDCARESARCNRWQFLKLLVLRRGRARPSGARMNEGREERGDFHTPTVLLRGFACANAIALCLRPSQMLRPHHTTSQRQRRRRKCRSDPSPIKASRPVGPGAHLIARAIDERVDQALHFIFILAAQDGEKDLARRPR